MVIAGGKETLGLEIGIDQLITETYGDTSDIDYFDKYFGPGRLFPDEPNYEFQIKQRFFMERWTPKESITSEILADTLEHIDSYGVFDWSQGKCPFFLLDGHQSRFDLPFLEYITNKDHEWQACIGVKYGTSL